MEVILVENVTNLGKIGELVKVAPGYARNFLLPQGLAIEASIKNKSRLAHEQRLMQFKRAKRLAESEQLASKLQAVSVTIARKVGEQDKLYGSVTTHDIAKALAAEGIKIDRHDLVLAEPIKALGIYEVPIRLHTELSSVVKVWVVAET